MSGPLHGTTFVEFAGIGPGPFCNMLLADLGATVIRIDRPVPGDGGDSAADFISRGRQSIAVDLKNTEGLEVVRRLLTNADALTEGFRPGVMERLGLGPADCAKLNPRLVYGRMTGWGQDGPLSPYAGHDINYISLTGALWATGRLPDKPVPPMNLVGDYGGGGMFLALGIVAALLEAQRSGQGQVVDTAMVDGAAVLSAPIMSWKAQGRWSNERGVNFLDTGAPHYEVYECADGKFVSVGALEPQFYAELVRLTGFEEDGDRLDPATYTERKARWAALFKTRTRDEWATIAGGSDACLAPVLDWNEAPEHPHMRARDTYVEVAGVKQPAPAPRFSRTPSVIEAPPPRNGENTDDVLRASGLTDDEIARLRAAGAIG